jgi:methionyl aminopeptidase
MGIKIHKKEDFESMRKAGKLASQTLDYITPFVAKGITTNELDKLCHDFIVQNGAVPAPLGYRGYPKSICTSINHVICHGIPSDKKLQDGDIINIDVTVIVDGWHGDTSRMYTIGKLNPKAKKLVEVTFEAMMLGIEQVKPGNFFGDIGFAIQTFAEKHGFSVVRDYCGHGIGKVFHDEPSVLHYGKKGTGPMIETGMFFTIEPMINAGSYESLLSKIDGWTVTTKDKSLSAQYEHTIGVTDTSYEIFTK